jgi:parallel beta-helix repeat protein
MRTLNRAIFILFLLFALLAAAFALLGFLPARQDPQIDPRSGGAGASSVEPSWTGLQREFPAIETPANAISSSQAIELGKLLFFDSVLSQDNTISCASCHHPDLGFADGKTHPIGIKGQVAPRHTPTLWNVAYAKSLFWDGRAASLEEQAGIPLLHPKEMGGKRDSLTRKVRSIAEYVQAFQAVFGGASAEESVTFENISRALAAFQRTLISHNSAYDRFVAGDQRALGEAQKRGLDLFRSAATRCFECHMAPNFSNDTFRSVGVPEEPGVQDPGRRGVAEDAQIGAFRVPSLRNVALTAPYMHNGAFATLEEVVEFYAKGGGRHYGNNDIDFFVQGFDLSAQERDDLVAFLYALTDESGKPSIPQSVPSGLPVVRPLDNPARKEVQQVNVSVQAAPPGAPRTLTVKSGEDIQAVVDQAYPGDTVEVEYGVYHQKVVVNASDITLRGLPNPAGDYPLLDGENKFADGVLVSGNNFVVEKLEIRNYTSNGVLAEGVRNVVMRDLKVVDTGVYGLYPVHSSGVLIEHIDVTGVNDAGIYAGQSEDIIVRDSVAYSNVIGIEIENSVNWEIYNNHTYANSAGLFFDLLPQLTSKVAVGGKVYNNLVENNNHPNFARPDMSAALIPAGTGVLLLGVDEVEVYSNTITGNNSGGVAVFRTAVAFDQSRMDIDDLPERNWIHSNSFKDNGQAPDAFLSKLGVPGADLLWDGSSWQNRFDQPGASSFPPLLPSSRWPDFAKRGYWQVLDFLVSRLL